VNDRGTPEIPAKILLASSLDSTTGCQRVVMPSVSQWQ